VEQVYALNNFRNWGYDGYGYSLPARVCLVNVFRLMKGHVLVNDNRFGACANSAEATLQLPYIH
jgi:hypothetical protein